MKYAIISDIHGNIHALEAVLADARAQGADMYLLIGDYACNYPYGNEVADAIRKLQPATVIRGNGEGYLIDLKGRDPQEMIYEQFKPTYWGYRSLSAANLEYMVNLPETAVVQDGETKIHLAHTMGLFYRSPKIELFHSHLFRKLMEAEPFTREEYLACAKAALLACPEAVAEIHAMPKGVYLFGHNHMQFHMEYEGRLFINPGSCGEPLDWDVNAPYTLLTVEGDSWSVEERRIAHDLDVVAEGFDSSGFTAYAPVWSEVMKLEIHTGKDYFSSFVKHVVETGHKMGEVGQPISNHAWDAAVATWDPLHLGGVGAQLSSKALDMK